METYEKLLDEAYKRVKVVETGTKERFEIPRANLAIDGPRTIFSNFMQIASYLRRNPEHLQKFLLKELAAPGKRDGERLILNIKIPFQKINDKIEQYAKQYVLCRECSKPDTELTSENRFTFIHCLACGAKHSVSKI